MEAILGSFALSGAFLWLLLETNWLRVRLAQPEYPWLDLIVESLPLTMAYAVVMAVVWIITGHPRKSFAVWGGGIAYIIVDQFITSLVTGTGKASAKELKELKELAGGESREGQVR